MPPLNEQESEARSEFTIQIADQQTTLETPLDEIQGVARLILLDAGVKRALLSIAVVDDPTIRLIHNEYLGVDEATDVVSFPLDDGEDEAYVEGEIVVSSDTAVRGAEQYGGTPLDELILYIVHGLLHLVGYDDHDPDERRTMREREAYYMQGLGRHYANADTINREE